MIVAQAFPLAPGPAQANYTAILRRMQAGEDLPPIVVYQLGYRYFVIDGHTRVAAAKTLGIQFLDAVVTEALPRQEGKLYMTYYARRDFERHTGLHGIRLTAPWRYHLLYRHVEGYWMYLERSPRSRAPDQGSLPSWMCRPSWKRCRRRRKKRAQYDESPPRSVVYNTCIRIEFDEALINAAKAYHHNRG